MPHNTLELVQRENSSDGDMVVQGKRIGESEDKFWRLPKIRPNQELAKVPTYLKALKVTVCINALLSLLTIIISWSENQWTASTSTQTFESDFLRFTVVVLSVLQVVLVCRYYSLRLQLQVAYGLLQPASKFHTAGLLESSLRGLVLFEAVLTCMCTPPMLYYHFTVGQHGRAVPFTIGDVIVGFTCLRAYQLIYILYWTEMPRDRFY